jgi:CHAD domain-containing protein
MKRVAVESERAWKKGTPRSIHQTRVSLRRCRAMAAILKRVDPRHATLYRKIHLTAKKAFQPLGPLRDTHVLEDWVKRLAPSPHDAVRKKILKGLAQRQAAALTTAQKGLSHFSRRKWDQLREGVVGKKGGSFDEALFQPIALKRFQKAKRRFEKAQKKPSEKKYHQLRIALKKFRYLMENFMPTPYAACGKELKQMQDLLGEHHDLAVLLQLFPAWKTRIHREQKKRLKQFFSLWKKFNSRRGVVWG